MDDFYAARSGTIPPLPWSTFSPPFSNGLFRLAEIAISGREDFVRRVRHNAPLEGIVVEQRGNSSITILDASYALQVM